MVVSNVNILQSLRHLVEGEGGPEERQTARDGALTAVEAARKEIQKSKDLRELFILEAQYGRRVKGRGVRRTTH